MMFFIKRLFSILFLAIVIASCSLLWIAGNDWNPIKHGTKVIDALEENTVTRIEADTSDIEREQERKQVDHSIEVNRTQQLALYRTLTTVLWEALPLALMVALVGAVWKVTLGRSRTTRWSAQVIGEAAMERARQIQPVPTTLTYSPSSTYAPRITGAIHTTTSNEESTRDPVADPALPPFIDLGTLTLPALDSVLLGLLCGGEPLANAWINAKHIVIIGPTGGGKSVLSKTLVVQARRAGHDIHILDPHFAEFDAESGEDWRGIVRRLQSPPVTATNDIVQRLLWAASEMDRRLDLRKQGKPYLPHIIRLVLDEVPKVVEEDAAAALLITRILREGRKVGVLLQVASQDLLAKTLGFKDGAAVRKNFSTAFIMRGCDRTSIRLFVKDRDFDPAIDLEVGAAAVVSEGIRGHRVVRVPFVSNDAVARILGPVAQRALSPETPEIPIVTVQRPSTAPVTMGISGEAVGEVAENSGESSAVVASSAIGSASSSAKDIAFAIWNVNPDVSYESVMDVAGIKKRSTARAYKTEWRKSKR